MVLVERRRVTLANGEEGIKGGAVEGRGVVSGEISGNVKVKPN